MIETKMIASIILFLLKTWPANPAYKNVDELAVEFVKYGQQYDVDPVLLVVMGFQESSLRTDLTGKLGEVGMFQVHGKSRKACLAANVSPFGIECGALLVDMNTRYCGSVRRGLHRYMSGKCKGTPRAIRKTEWRLNKVNRLKDKCNVR